MTMNSGFLRALLDNLNKSPENMIGVSKPILRMIVMELIRLTESQTMQEEKRAMFIQRMTMEYACAHICDLLIGLMETDMRGVQLNDLLFHAIKQIEELANQSAPPTQGITA